MPRSARRAIVLVFGVTALLLGAAMLLLPGPGILGLLVGLSILATEFAWARRLLRRARRAAGLEPAPPEARRDDASQTGAP